MSARLEITEPAARLQLLEQRRLAFDAMMWEVPALTVAGQAFLLQVVTSDTVGWTVALPVAIAGVIASAATGLSLWQQGAAERLHSEEVAELAEEVGIGDPRRAAIVARRSGRAESWRLRGRTLWYLTLAAFVVADVVALFAGR